MRVLAMTSLFPNPYQTNLWSPNRLQLSWLARQTPVDVIAPLPWTTERRGRKLAGNLLNASRTRTVDNLTVEHVPYYFPPGTLRALHGKCYRWSVAKALQRHVSAFKPDVVFTHWAYPDGWAAVKLGHAHKLPVVIQVMGSDVLLLKDTPSRRPGTIEALQQADGIWAVSQDLARNVETLGVASDRVRVIYDGVDTSLFHPGSQDEARERLKLDITGKIILFVGNLVGVKAIDKLLDACELLHQQGIAFHTAVIGQGELRGTLEKQLSKLQCHGAVKFYGSIPQETLPDWYRAADVLVLPSYSEGVPNVLLEASACRLPYVASNVGGIPEIAGQGQGLLVPPGDASALANAIKEQLAAPRRESHATRSRGDCITDFMQFLKQTHARYHATPNTNAHE
jgi:glycosyltransferase involved in cell wall biosynthesis